MSDNSNKGLSDEDILDFFDELEEQDIDLDELEGAAASDSDCSRRLRTIAVWTLASCFCLWRKCRKKPACAKCNKRYKKALESFRADDYLKSIWLANRAIRCYCRNCC